MHMRRTIVGEIFGRARLNLTPKDSAAGTMHLAGAPFEPDVSQADPETLCSKDSQEDTTILSTLESPTAVEKVTAALTPGRLLCCVPAGELARIELINIHQVFLA